MFYGLKDSWQEMLKKASYIVDDNGISISFPQHLFDKFEQEFNICFVDEDEDVHFKFRMRRMMTKIASNIRGDSGLSDELIRSQKFFFKKTQRGY